MKYLMKLETKKNILTRIPGYWIGRLVVSDKGDNLGGPVYVVTVKTLL